MKHHKPLIRTLQFFTSLAALAIIIMLLLLFEVIPFNQKNLRRVSEKTQPLKVKRPQAISNITTQELIDEGDRAVFRNDIQAALRAYQKASDADPKESLPYEKIGDLFLSEKKYESALQNFQLAASLNTGKPTLPMKIVQSYLGLRKILAAKEEIEKMNPPTQYSLYYQGLISAFLNEPTQAKEFLEQSKTAGSDEKIAAQAERILAVYRNFELARDAPSEYLQVLLANAFDQVGEYGLAIELAFNALKTHHDYRDAWIILGHAFLNEHKWLDSEDALTKAIDLDAMYPQPFFFRGIARKNLKKHLEAVTDLETALKMGWQPTILAKQELAENYFELLDYARAFPLYKEVAFSDPTDINRFIRPMALAINHLGQPREANLLAQKAYETHPDSAMAYNLLGWAAMAHGDFGNSRKNLEEALRRDPELPAVYLNLGQLAEREGDTTEALRNYEIAINLAQKFGDASIGNTAEVRYNELKNREQATGNRQQDSSNKKQETQRLPSPTTIIPSLSLE